MNILEKKLFGHGEMSPQRKYDVHYLRSMEMIYKNEVNIHPAKRVDRKCSHHEKNKNKNHECVW